MTIPESSPPSSKRNKILLFMTLTFFLIGTALFLYWWIYGRFHEHTNDAYVSGNLVYVTPQVEASILSVYVDDTNLVEEGHLLLTLDSTDFIIRLEESKANLGKVIRDVSQLFIQANEAKSLIEVAKANFNQAVQDFERRVLLVDSGSVSQEDFDHAENALTAAYFTLVSAEQNFFSLETQTEKTSVRKHPRVKEAVQRLKQAWVDLSRCTLRAPVKGLIAQKNAQVGMRVGKKDPLLAVIPLDQIWIDANFKEIQIGKMQIGQKVQIKSDIYGRKVKYEGHVIGIGGGTGSVFSLLPPQNATGNWIKIVQRVPVRIALDPKQIRQYPLRLGLSVEVNVDIHDLEQSSIPDLAPSKALYQTDIFEDEECGVETIIEQIFQDNFTPLYEENA